MALIDHAAHYLGMGLHIAALHEESTLDVIVAQDVQHPGGQRSMGTVIKGEGHHLVRHSHTVDRYPRNARGKRSIIIGRAYGRHRNGLGRQFHGRPVRLFPGAVTGEMVVFTGEPDSAGCSWCWEQADRPNARAHARNKCFFITGFGGFTPIPPSCHVLNHPSVRHEKESAPMPRKE